MRTNLFPGDFVRLAFCGGGGSAAHDSRPRRGRRGAGTAAEEDGAVGVGGSFGVAAGAVEGWGSVADAGRTSKWRKTLRTPIKNHSQGIHRT